MSKRKVNRLANFGRITWLYTKYQLLTKTVVALLFFPLMNFLVRSLLSSTGRTNLSSGDYVTFLLTPQGIAFIVIGLIVLVVMMGMDINAFVIAGALVHTGRIKLTARQLLIVALRSLRDFLNPLGVVLLAYVALVGPLIGSGITIGPLQKFQIPNFITDVIYKNPLYLTLYIAVLGVLFYLSFRYVFFLHYVLLVKQSPREALKNATTLMSRHWKQFIKDFIVRGLLVVFGFIAGLFVIGVICGEVVPLFVDSPIVIRILTLYGVLFVSQLLWFVAMMTVPLLLYRLTVLFYRYHQQDYGQMPFNINIKAWELGDEAYGKVQFKTKAAITLFIVGMLTVNAIIAVPVGLFFDDIFRMYKKIDIVAHRGGGDLAAENTIASLEAAIQEGVAWSEIDVQRTADGHYIINHDANFKRVAGESRTSSEMTLAEIQKLRVQDFFDSTRESQPVATLEQMLQVSKGKIGLFIELKGKTADTQMVDDVVKMVKAHQMEKEVALLSLDYPLIQYIEANYPEMTSGFLYFFAVGDVANLEGDILIMEEREATSDKIDDIHQAGKKAVVWTVNTEESIDKFINSQVDGIITDYVKAVQEGEYRRNQRTDLEVILDSLLDGF